MESCGNCHHNRWFIERKWNINKQETEIRVVCKNCGNSSEWILSDNDDDTIKNWNREQKLWNV